MDDLLPEFIAETREMLAAISGEIVAWEAEPGDRDRLDAIFRFVHTVKGSCGFLDLPRLERLSHAAEDVLADVRASRRRPDAALVSAVLGVIDRIGELAEAIESGASLPDEEDHQLIAALAPDAAPAAPRTAPAAGPNAPANARAITRTIRLPIDLLDRMMSGVSDMVLARNELARKLREAGTEGAVEAAFERLSVCVAEMRDAITRTRMQRIDNIFSALPRMVRDLSGELGKLVMLEIDGGDVELDREMIELIRDPLTHIIRNAVDHGIELPEDRRAAGKSAAGRLLVSARQTGNHILIEIVDDGRGIDGDRLVQRALAAGLVSADRIEAMAWPQKLALMFEPGLSTAKAVTAISGRGVGMDVVRANVERIGGVVEIDSRPRQGARFTLRVPLTLTIIPALTITAGGESFAIPRAAIEEIVRTGGQGGQYGQGGQGARIERIGGASLANIRGRRVPVVALDRLIRAEEPALMPAIMIVLKPAGGDLFALGVDAVHDHEELVVKPAAPAVMAAGLYAGTTLPDNGRPMLLLDPAGVAQVAGVLHEPTAPIAAAPPVETETVVRVPALMFRDLDGRERAIRLAVVERIEDVAAEAIQESAGCRRLAHEGRLIAVLGHAPASTGRVRVLRISDGAAQVAYAIDEVLDIVEVDAADFGAAQDDAVAGVTLIEGHQVELLDPYWLFAHGAAAPVRAERPVALLADADDNWMREVLRPLVEAAGYRVTFAGEGAATADLVIVGEKPAAPAGQLPKAPLIRLRADPVGAEDSIYRYDRPALVAALRRPEKREARR